MFMSPMVSIITPCYNSRLYISKTIESVISQTYENWEMIIVDDCSEDNSVEIIEKYQKQDSRIILILMINLQVLQLFLEIELLNRQKESI